MIETSDIAVVIVTYKRTDLLKILLNSITKLNHMVGAIYVVDNDNSAEVKQIVKQLNQTTPKLHSKTNFTTLEFKYLPQAKNTGGAGGFYTGTKAAYLDSYKWFWLVDDDVKMTPYALDILLPKMSKYKMIQGQRLDYDRSTFYWQYNFNTHLGIPNPLSSSMLERNEIRPMNTACFEGTIFHKSLVDKIGYPDPRFFIYWDDTIYGYLASKYTQPVYIEGTILQRTRQVKNLDLGARHLRSTSDLVRYNMMKNRGLMANYYKLYGDYNPVTFAIGTLLTLAKETIRIVSVDKTYKSSFRALWRGFKKSQIIKRQTNWQPAIWYKKNLKEFDDLIQTT
ncbi:MAG: glycosyltransferase [Bifidobacteriaceae bacterium]|jgi:glycosyltransferase involved in cell wall biosynthesis|nr:glycosyltransferase [Bifidobacteriaceae bacterium]